MDKKKLAETISEYLECFGEKSRKLRRELVSKFEGSPAWDRDALVDMILEKAVMSKSEFSIDNSVEFLAAVDHRMVQRAFMRAVVKNITDIDYWLIVHKGLSRSDADEESKNMLLSLVPENISAEISAESI